MDLAFANSAAPITTAGPTGRFAKYLAAISIETIDAFARRAATRHLIDSLGAILAGSEEPATRSAERALQAAGTGAGPVAMPGITHTYDALHAAYVGGTSCHGLELDDGYRPGSVHPGAVVVPAALALGAVRGSSGRELLRATVVGYEAVCRIAAAAHPRARWRGFHNTGIAGVFGSAAAASALLGLDAAGIENAFGVAGSSAAGLFAFLGGGDVKRTHPGHAAREGLLAALLTQAGLLGPRGVLEFKEGFFNAFAGGDADAVDYSAIDLLACGDNNARSPFAVANCYLKPYACCRHIHPAIDAVLDICKNENVTAGEIENVSVGTYAVAASHGHVGWSEMTTAQMSYPFSVATAIVRGHVDLNDFGDKERADPAVLAMTRRINVAIDAECDASYPRLRAAKVSLSTRDGRAFERYVPEPYGAASNPLSDAALKAKFIGLATKRVGQLRALQAFDLLWNIETLANLEPLLTLLRPMSPC